MSADLPYVSRPCDFFAISGVISSVTSGNESVNLSRDCITGGLAAVIYTDTFQTVVMTVGAFTLIIIGEISVKVKHT